MRILVLGNANRPGVREAVERLLPFLRQHCEIALVDLEQKKDLSGSDADLTLVLGGDGAILRAARQMGYCQTPVLGVNLGRLGFLADLSPEELCSVFPRVMHGDYRVTEHLMFECLIESPSGRQIVLGLNETALLSGPPFHMIGLDLVIDGEAVSGYSGDGLIISTPIGSTAHSLSAGGPILGQELSAFVVTPICPHMLTNRPVVDSADKVYTIAVRRLLPTSSLVLVIDGQEHSRLTVEHRVTVRKAPVSFRLVKVPGRSYYQTLRDKLHWGAPPSYRHEPSAEDERT
ncbi:MAG: NAD(+)/NADH kinase [Gemmataceae bacterium]